MLPVWRLCFLLLIDFCLVFAYPKRFTIEIPDGETFCAYENLFAQKKYALMYQVIHGGNLDVDLIIRDPMKRTIHETKRGSHEDIKFDSHVNGTFEFCFGNEFSSLSEKLVYFELRPDPYETLSEEAGEAPHVTVLTMVQSALESAHLYLSHAESTQIELRNRELGDRLVAEDLNQAVLYWSIAVTIAIFVTTLGQVTILKNFFADKKVFYSTRASRM
ncbi:putative cop-coated vesicle membrane protein P24 (Emp24/gp25l family) [Fasciola hepatica]|uniref:Cop-coated vesicle membrane protein P24 (Emp24/gp25l family) n=1 Tax=Fasciola hepatica TaxID=6192 RepID=A0A4E0RLK3_FASHE|nr:putative cop-coated vesicle membrane protein P24 (Emp24/gp25l family) [Fasciola hepatica]